MRCPTLAELPPPPPGKTGWPWTVESPQLPDAMPDGSPWPRISIVTPSYNQGEYIEETIRSVLLQGYPNLEYIVMDGESSDRSVEAIEKYDRWLACWQSEADRGQAHAINKGVARATGEIFNWINSDDRLSPGALAAVGAAFRSGSAVAGAVVNFSEQDRRVVQNGGLSGRAIVSGDATAVYQQPGLWLDLHCMRDVGPLPEEMNYVFDLFHFIRYVTAYPDVLYIDNELAEFRLHPTSKTVAEGERFETERRVHMESMLRDERLSSLHSVVRARLQTFAWWKALEEMEAGVGPGFPRAAVILVRAMGFLPASFSRLTAGAVRNAFSSSVRA